MSYQPAESIEPIKVGRTDAPIAQLVSHPKFPHTLHRSIEGAFVDLNPAWVWASLRGVLSRLDPPCHTNYEDYLKTTKKKRKIKFKKKGKSYDAFVVWVRPGLAPSK